MNKLNCIKILCHELHYIFMLLLIIAAIPILLIFGLFLKLRKVLHTMEKGKNIKGQVALITGSARGLGRLLAIELAERGCHVAIVDILQDLGEETANYINDNYDVNAKFYKVDVTNYNQLEQLNKNVTLDLGPITILINNAAAIFPLGINELTPQEIQNMINVNVVAMCYTNKIFLPKMKELNRGYIVNISSISALYNSPIFGIYGGTKAAMRSIATALRIQLMNECKNISVTTVMPNIMNTNKTAEEFIRKSRINQLIPIVEGDIVAKYVMKAMLNNENEIAVPCGLLYIHKIAELMPFCVREYIFSLLTLRSKNYLF